MRYCLVQKKTGRVTFLMSKSSLHDWISTHWYCLSSFIIGCLDVHRVIVECGLHGFPFYSVGPKICSLGDYITKHKLFES